MKQTHKLFRTIVDTALEGRRSWSSVGELAWEAGVGESWAYKALRHPTSIGATAKLPGGGISVTDPERLLMILSAKRSFVGGHCTSLEASQRLIAASAEYALGGTRAAAQHLGGVNAIADHAEVILYLPEGAHLDELPQGVGALVLEADPRSMQSWADGFTSKAQTYADLFAQPEWQASEFRRALWRDWFAVDDWARGEA